MNKNTLDLTSIKDALAQLKTSLAFCSSELAKSDSAIFQQFRSAAIQAFELNYELAHKYVRKQLISLEASPSEIAEMSFNDLIRQAALRGLIRSPEKWFEFRQKRNATSHTYNESKAEAIYNNPPSPLY